MGKEEKKNIFHIEVWKENALFFIQQLESGQILSADNIVELAEKDPEWLAHHLRVHGSGR